jgi:hypothetical protein
MWSGRDKELKKNLPAIRNERGIRGRDAGPASTIAFYHP